MKNEKRKFCLSKFIKRYKVTFIIGFCIAAIICGLILQKRVFPEPSSVSYVEFTKMVEKGTVSKITIDSDSGKMTFETKTKKYSTDNPEYKNFKKDMLEKNINVEENSGSPITAGLIIQLLFLISIIGLSIAFVKNTFGKSTGNVSEIPTFGFEKMAGNEEAKEEVMDVVSFLKNPKMYTDCGAKLPKGIILHGEPGTGKTLLAKCVAGEAKVPFYYMSGSDFIEMFAGVGAGRIRKLFKSAREHAPCIIFIDEIDSIGSRDNNTGNSEKNQTINAFLTEMDGFNESTGIVVIAATNRLDMLDKAIVRPGRFDRHVRVSLPDVHDREKILELHAQNKTLTKDVDIHELAKITAGLSGASLDSILNEAAIMSVNECATHLEGAQPIITKANIDAALLKVITHGKPKKHTKERLEKDRAIAAWHEAGHALTTKLLTETDVSRVSIVPSTAGSGGYTLSVPSDNEMTSRDELFEQICILYAGRAAEEIRFGANSVTTGASNDIERASNLIKNMVYQFGMGHDMLNGNIFSDKKIMENDMREISAKAYNVVISILNKNRDLLDKIAEKLLEFESIDNNQLNEIIEQTRYRVVVSENG